MVTTVGAATSSRPVASASRTASARTEVRPLQFAIVFHPNNCAVSYDEFKKATEAELQPMKIHVGTMGESIVPNAARSRTDSLAAFMFESSMIFTLTDYAMKSPKRHGAFLILFCCHPLTGLPLEHEPKMWDNLKGQFMNHIPQINTDLEARGLPPLGKK